MLGCVSVLTGSPNPDAGLYITRSILNFPTLHVLVAADRYRLTTIAIHHQNVAWGLYHGNSKSLLWEEDM